MFGNQIRISDPSAGYKNFIVVIIPLSKIGITNRFPCACPQLKLGCFVRNICLRNELPSIAFVPIQSQRRIEKKRSTELLVPDRKYGSLVQIVIASVVRYNFLTDKLRS